MKKRIKFIFTLFTFILICTNKVQALSVSKSNLTIDEGKNDTVELYANFGEEQVNEITFSLLFDSYDASADFIPVSNYNSTSAGTNYTISFSDGKSGQVLLGTIKVKVKEITNIVSSEVRAINAVATSLEGEKINLNKATLIVNINKVTPTVNDDETTTKASTTTTTTTTKASSSTTKSTTTTVTTTNTKSENKGLLKGIQSKITKIDLQDDVFEYTVSVNEGVEELDLVPIPNDDGTKIDISSQKISELKDKQIIITLNNNNLEEKYVINVKVTSKQTIKNIEIDNKKFVEKTGYKGKWVVAIILLGGTLIVSALFVNNKKK